MEVTKSNFKETLPQIQKAIDDCTFVSIDCELTGLKTTCNHINAFDTPKQYFEKVRKDCREFLVIQYGLSIFRYTEEDIFKQQTYNFYIFRRPIDRLIPDQRFLCQTSSVDFLITQGFDFNKLFKEGISYLNVSEEAKCREQLAEQYKRRVELRLSQSNSNSNNDIITIPEENQGFINDVIKSLQDFLETDKTEIQLPRCNAFIRRLIYQTKTEKFNDKINLETRQVDKDRILFATKAKSNEEIEELEKEKYESSMSELEDYIGFTKVLQMIVESGKLVIGHNLMLDFLHSIEKFLTPLPDEYEEFKECANSLFPKILDTKYMSSIEPFKELINSNVLKHLLNTVSEKPFQIPKIEIEENCQGYSINDDKEHEAGYDAYITALSFLAMWKYLGATNNLTDAETFSNLNLLDPFINRIFLMILSDNQYINLSGEDVKPSRDHVFYITFPKEWKNSNIMQLFSPFGNVFISWVDDSSAFVSLHKRDQASIALATLSQSDTYSVITYAKRQAQLSGITQTKSPLGVKRKTKNEVIQPIIKKIRPNSLERSTPKRSVRPIEEQNQPEAETSVSVGNAKSLLSSTSSIRKTFNEEASWD